MDFLEIMTAGGNKFDGGYSMGAREMKALRDGIVHLLAKVKELEARLPIQPVVYNAPVEAGAGYAEEAKTIDGDNEAQIPFEVKKKRGRPKA